MPVCHGQWRTIDERQGSSACSEYAATKQNYDHATAAASHAMLTKDEYEKDSPQSLLRMLNPQSHKNLGRQPAKQMTYSRSSLVVT